VAIDPRDGSVYFGLGTGDFTNAYQMKDGQARYSLASERGTILRVAPDFKSREIVATGIRFSVGLAFNRGGDLFCTDQEGATWLPNGNPFDELLYIQKGRHYGFPPRHPQHLPGVIDEPSVFDYSPQHQSTCGLVFNEPVNGGPVFGPAWWQGDALLAGYSRGKLYRTQLVKSSGGYVARNQLLASLGMLACDVCVSPRGELVVAVHGGGPDWGSGPNGKGRLYKIAYTGRELAQPVAAWAQGPREVRVAFDRPLEPEHLQKLAAHTAIEYGAYVSPGDRFETLRPGYQAVQDQLAAPRQELPVLGAQVTPDRRTLILATAPHPEAVNYALTLPGLGRPPKAGISRSELPQVPETDLRYDLCGVEAAWQDAAGKTRWQGWLPHVSLDVARALTAGSSGHDELWALCRQPGRLTLRTRLDLHAMLRPAVQPGSKIDYEWPAERVTVSCRTRADLTVKTAAGLAPFGRTKDGAHTASVTVLPAADKPELVELTLATGGATGLSVTYHTNEDSRPRALPLHRLLLPWAPLKKQEVPATAARDIPELQGGNWERGRQAFFGAAGLCSRCHRIRGEGSQLGPDLSNLPQRDYASVLRDIVNPDFAINPDYLTQVVELKDGRVLVGTVRSEKNNLYVGEMTGQVLTVSRDAVETMTTSAKSLMPEGLDRQLGPERLRDLLVFLLTEPPHMPDYGKAPPPPPRSRQEVLAVLAGAPDTPAKTRSLRIVLVAGRKDHGIGEHDYPAWQKVWKQLLEMAEDTRVTTAQDWPAAEDLKSADVLVFYQQGKWTRERARDIDAFLERGGGLDYIHYAVDGGADSPGFAQRIGLAWQGGKSKFRHGPLDLGFETGTKHPIGRNFDKVHFEDESYWQLAGDPKKINLLASGLEDGKPQPLFWTLEPGKGRVVVSIPGHFAWTFDDPLFRILLLRGIAWAAREPVDRFNELATVGARIKD
jgi:putative heme-binding domain-containing protein